MAMHTGTTVCRLMVFVFGLHSALHATLNIWSRIAVARSFNTATLSGQVTRLHSVSLAHAIECLRMPHTHTQRVQTLYSGSSIRSMLNMWAYMWRCIHSRSVGASCVYPPCVLCLVYVNVVPSFHADPCVWCIFVIAQHIGERGWGRRRRNVPVPRP